MVKTEFEFIKDLHGNTYRLGEYKLCLEFPKFEGITVLHHRFTRDVLTGNRFNLIETENKFYMVRYSKPLDMYVKYSMVKVSYNPLEDLRQSHLHGNKYHS
jgi:hypothetical protein